MQLNRSSDTSCEELTYWKRPWCWEGMGAGGKGDDRGWDGCMASPTQWTWVWVNSGSWWWTGRPGVLRFMGSQRVGHDWATELSPRLVFLLPLDQGIHSVSIPWWLSSKQAAWQCRRLGLSPWVGKIPWRRKWQHTPVFLPGESHGQRSLVG